MNFSRLDPVNVSLLCSTAVLYECTNMMSLVWDLLKEK